MRPEVIKVKPYVALVCCVFYIDLNIFALLVIVCLCCIRHKVVLAMMGHMVVLGTALGTLMVPGYWSLQMG